jgi:pimeloyl-ACP methyl ester carboxylesterase
MIGHSMGGNGDAFATLYPEMVDKLIIADIAPNSIRNTINLFWKVAVDFSKKPSRTEVEEILHHTYRILAPDSF